MHIDSDVRRGQLAGFNFLVGQFCYAALMQTDVSPFQGLEGEARMCALPAHMYQRISFAAWAAAFIGGALSWTMLLYLV